VNPRAASWGAAERALARDGVGRFVRPAWNGRALPSITASLLAATGHDAPDAPVPLAPPLSADLDPFHGGRAEGPIVLFLIDSLGWRSFRAAVERPTSESLAPLANWAEHAAPITTVFPSTTTAAMTALSTATFPGRNGVVGHREFLPRWGVVADLLRMAPMTATGHDTLIGPGWLPRELTGTPTVFELGLSGCALSRDKFAGTAFTRLLYTGAEYCPYSTASDLAYELALVLSRPRPPEVVFVYWDELDTSHHLRGPDQYLFDLEVDRLAHLVRAAALRVDPEVRRRVTLLVTGDHGQVACPESANLPLEQHPALLQLMVHPPAGDRRAGFFALREGSESEFESRIRPLLPAESHYWRMDRAIEEHLFGPPPYHPEIKLRTGTFLAVPAQPGGITYAAPGNPVPRRRFAGAHSGLEPEEMWVPLISGTLEALTGPFPEPGSRAAADKT